MAQNRHKPAAVWPKLAQSVALVCADCLKNPNKDVENEHYFSWQSEWAEKNFKGLEILSLPLWCQTDAVKHSHFRDDTSAQGFMPTERQGLRHENGTPLDENAFGRSR